MPSKNDFQRIYRSLFEKYSPIETFDMDQIEIFTKDMKDTAKKFNMDILWALDQCEKTDLQQALILVWQAAIDPIDATGKPSNDLSITLGKKIAVLKALASCQNTFGAGVHSNDYAIYARILNALDGMHPLIHFKEACPTELSLEATTSFAL